MASPYASPRVLSLLALGFASGLPLALTSGTLQAWATVENVSLTQIGFLTLVGSAYTLKFLWAPLIDRFAFPILGRRRGWILVSQFLLALSIVAMGLLSPGSQLMPLAFLAVFVAFMSATQDIAFDAYSTDVLQQNERAAGAALRVLGYRIAMLVSSGLALILADKWLGWQYTYMLMGGVMAVCMIATLLAPEPELKVKPPRSVREAVVEPFKEFFTRPGALSLLLLIVLYKLGDAFAGALSTTFLIRGAGFSLSDIGYINKIFGLASTIVGALLGGSIMARLGLYRALMCFGILQAVSNLGYWVLSVSESELWLMAVVVGLENLCGGLGTVASVALLMALCNRQFSATQFALLSALAAVGRTYLAGPLTPFLVEGLGWPTFFLVTIVIALPGLFLLRWRKQQILALDHSE